MLGLEASKRARKPKQSEARLAAWRSILQAQQGRRVLGEILGQSNLLQASYVPGDALAMAYNEGLRAMGLWLKQEIMRADPALWAALLEQKEEDEHVGG